MRQSQPFYLLKQLERSPKGLKWSKSLQRLPLYVVDNKVLFPDAEMISSKSDAKSGILATESAVIIAYVLGKKGSLPIVGQLATLAELNPNKNSYTGIQICFIERIEKKSKATYAFVRLLTIKNTPLQLKKQTTLLKVAKRLATQLLINLPDASSSQNFDVLKNCKNFGELVAFVLPFLSLNQDEIYELFVKVFPLKQFDSLIAILGREIELSKISLKIQRNIVGDLNDAQRKFFLNEQLKAIKKELGEQDELDDEETEKFREILLAKSVPISARRVFEKEIDKLSMMPVGSPEYLVSYNYLDVVKDLPWQETEPAKKRSLTSALRILNKGHFGQSKVKSRVLEFLALFIHRGHSNGQILLLNGPPGVGKTSIAMSIAQALGLKFAKISLGGVKDEAELRGHRKTYIGAMPGKIIQALKQAGSAQCVILLDEIDKLTSSASQFHHDVIGPLLEILDPDHNKEFVDHYLSVPFDLSRVVFIATANDADAISAPLLDRMERIDLGGYTENEKIQIAKKHLIPRVCADFSIKEPQFNLSEEFLRSVVRFYTREAGVRQLKRHIELCGRNVVKAIVQKNKLESFTPESINKLFGPIKYIEEPRDQTLQKGVAIGLVYTGSGGDILYIETAMRMDSNNRGQLKVTGSLGKVIQESAAAALSFLAGHAHLLGMQPSDFDKMNFHIHFPDGATPKDGPSAGVGIVCALASQILQRPLPADLVMTGEVTLRGQVLAIGGLREKLLAAQRYGKKRVFIPKANTADLVEIPRDVRQALEIIPIERMSEALYLSGMLDIKERHSSNLGYIAH
ncbi:MAG: endopeptidase La [Oligoflexales bacterium]|nr:endopeptidase La [Oligoflexales bacterium]